MNKINRELLETLAPLESVTRNWMRTSVSVINGFATRLSQLYFSARPYGHRDYTPFVILGTARIGSTLLMTLLRSHPQMVVYPEVFLPRRLGLNSYLQHHPVDFLDRSIYRVYPKDIKAVGFKLFYGQAKSEIAMKRVKMRGGADKERLKRLDDVRPYLLGKQNLKIIHLKRKNLLRSLLSLKRAWHTKSWQQKKARASEYPDIEIGYEEAKAFFSKIEREAGENARFFDARERLEVEYEQLVQNPKPVLERIQQFLGIPERELSSPLRQQGSDRLSTALGNYTELKARFHGTSWSRFFEE